MSRSHFYNLRAGEPGQFVFIGPVRHEIGQRSDRVHIQADLRRMKSLFRQADVPARTDPPLTLNDRNTISFRNLSRALRAVMEPQLMNRTTGSPTQVRDLLLIQITMALEDDFVEIAI